MKFAEDAESRAAYFTEPRWVATLSDGRTAFGDSGGPAEGKSAWLRLGEFCRVEGLGLTGLRLEFRSHVVRPLPDNAAGYFLRTALVADVGTGANRWSFLVGVPDETAPSLLNVQRWGVPELVKDGEEVRRLDDAEAVGESFIEGPKPCSPKLSDTCSAAAT